MSILIISRGVNRRAAERRVVRRKLTADPGQIEHASDPAHQVIVRYHLVEPELVEKLFLLVLQPPHHRQPPQRIVSERRNHRSRKPSTTFATKSAKTRHLQCSKACICHPKGLGHYVTVPIALCWRRCLLEAAIWM